MIEFFELLNGCSALRTLAYLISILAFTFIVFAGITDIIRALMGTTKIKVVKNETSDDDPSQPWNYRKTEEETLNNE